MNEASRDPTVGVENLSADAPVAFVSEKPTRLPASVIPFAQRPLGTKLIIVYKFVRAPIMLALAVWLTVAPASVFRSLGFVAQELEEAGAAWAQAGVWIQGNLTSGVLAASAVLAWLDAASTALEGLLLLSGRAWADWIVIVELACLLPFELAYLAHRPGFGRLMLLVINALIVLYLARGRLRRQRATVSAR